MGGENTLWQLADIQAAGDISITAAGDANLEGVNLNAGGDASITAGGNVNLYAVADERSTYYEKRKTRKWGRKSKRTKNTNTTTQQGTALTGDNISVVSGTAPETDSEGELLNGDIHIVGSSLTAEGDIDLNAGRSLILEAAADRYYEKTTHKRSGGGIGSAFSSAQTNRKGKGQSETTQVTHISSELSAGGNISLQARSNIILQAARVQAGRTVSLNALAGGIAMLVATDIDSYSMEKEGSSVGWVSGEGEGHYHETVRMTEIEAGKVIMNALNGFTVEHLGEEGEDYSKRDVLEATLDQLADENPAYGYLKQLKDQDNVEWQAVVEAHEEWDYDFESMSEVATAVVIIVVTIVTAGTGTGFVAAASSAATSALYSTAAVSLINNQGDLGAVFEEMASSDTIKKIATSAITAGALSYAGAATGVDMDISSAGFDVEGIQTIALNAGVSASVDTAINGGSLSDNLGNALVNNIVTAGTASASATIANSDLDAIFEYALEGVNGCLAGKLTNDDCKGGAAGAIAGKFTGYQLESDNGELSKWSQGMAEIFGGLAAEAVGGEFSTGQGTGVNAAKWGRTDIEARKAAELAAAEEQARKEAELIRNARPPESEPRNVNEADFNRFGLVGVDLTTYTQQELNALYAVLDLEAQYGSGGDYALRHSSEEGFINWSQVTETALQENNPLAALDDLNQALAFDDIQALDNINELELAVSDWVRENHVLDIKLAYAAPDPLANAIYDLADGLLDITGFSLIVDLEDRTKVGGDSIPHLAEVILATELLTSVANPQKVAAEILTSLKDSPQKLVEFATNLKSKMSLGGKGGGPEGIPNVDISQLNKQLDDVADASFPPGSVGAAQVWSKKARLNAAELPTEGKIRFVPPRGYHSSEPLPRGPNNGFIDKFGNEWVRGPSRTQGEAFEWDIQLSNTGKAKIGWLSNSGNHVNVSLKGRVTH